MTTPFNNFPSQNLQQPGSNDDFFDFEIGVEYDIKVTHVDHDIEGKHSTYTVFEGLLAGQDPITVKASPKLLYEGVSVSTPFFNPLDNSPIKDFGRSQIMPGDWVRITRDKNKILDSGWSLQIYRIAAIPGELLQQPQPHAQPQAQAQAQAQPQPQVEPQPQAHNLF